MNEFYTQRTKGQHVLIPWNEYLEAMEGPIIVAQTRCREWRHRNNHTVVTYFMASRLLGHFFR